VKCQIVKYTDRIWVDAEKNKLSILRSFIVHVLEDSPVGLTRISFLLPAKEKNVSPCYDKSDLCFRGPEELFFNSGKTLGYVVEQHDECGTINDDGIQATVCTGNKIEKDDVAGATLVIIRFPKVVVRGEYREVRVAFEVSNYGEHINEAILSLSFPYLPSREYRRVERLFANTLEIPVKPILDMDTLQGGFDVFVYLSSKSAEAGGWHNCEFQSDKHIIDGSEIDTPMIKHHWRMRHALVEEGMTKLTFPTPHNPSQGNF